MDELTGHIDAHINLAKDLAATCIKLKDSSLNLQKTITQMRDEKVEKEVQIKSIDDTIQELKKQKNAAKNDTNRVNQIDLDIKTKETMLLEMTTGKSGVNAIDNKIKDLERINTALEEQINTLQESIGNLARNKTEIETNFQKNGIEFSN